MSASEKDKFISGRRTYRRCGSMIPDTAPQVMSAGSDTDSSTSDHEESPQSQVSPRSRQSTKKYLKSPKRAKSSNKDTSRTLENSFLSTQQSPNTSTIESSFRSDNSTDLSCSHNQSTHGGNWLVPITVIVVAVVVAAYALPSVLSFDYLQEPNLPPRNCSFEDLKRKYPTQENILWKSLRVQIEGILNKDPAVPSVFLFLHTKDGTEELIWKIAKTASACFDPSLEPIKLDDRDFTSQASIDDYGVIIKKFKEQIGDGGALLVANLNEIPGKAARALHAICDTYSPIIDRVVVFLTLTVLSEGNPLEIAENTLHEIWGSSISRHELDPLITRVTEQVFHLTN